MPDMGESPYGSIGKLIISLKGVKDQPLKINPSKSQGPDGIPPWFIKTFAD